MSITDSTFLLMIAHVFKSEGGYVNDPHDVGGETNYGISKKAYPNRDIKNLTREEAVDIYYADYWTANHCHELPPAVAMLHFDGCINQGAKRSNRALQKAAHCTIDGVFGKNTAKAVDSMYRADKHLFLEDFAAGRLFEYMRLREELLTRFGYGWSRRLISLYSEAVGYL